MAEDRAGPRDVLFAIAFFVFLGGAAATIGTAAQDAVQAFTTAHSTGDPVAWARVILDFLVAGAFSFLVFLALLGFAARDWEPPGGCRDDRGE